MDPLAIPARLSSTVGETAKTALMSLSLSIQMGLSSISKNLISRYLTLPSCFQKMMEL
jgi:hypothetical protein